MSLPRAIVPGRRYMLTRRCSEHRFFMRPDRETNNAFIYSLALAARKASNTVVLAGVLGRARTLTGVRPTDTVRPLQCGMKPRFVNMPICLTRICNPTLQRRSRIRDTPRRP